MQLRFLSGPNHLNKKLEAEKYVRRHQNDRDLMLRLAEEIAFDRNVELGAEEVPQTIEAWGRERTVKNRGLYVPVLDIAAWLRL